MARQYPATRRTKSEINFGCDDENGLKNNDFFAQT
jgi:hypothetical protein